MQAKFQIQQPNFKFSEDDKYYYCFICLNEQQENEINEMGDSQIEYLYDYNSFKIEKEDLDLFSEIKNNPEKFLNYIPKKPLTLEEEIIKLKKDNETLKQQINEIVSLFRLNI